MAALRRPWVTALLMTVLLVDSCSLPATTTLGRYAIVPRLRCGCSRPPGALVVQQGCDLKLIDQYDDAAREVDERSIIAMIECNPRRRVGGFWAATREWWDPTVRVIPYSRTLTATEIVALRPQFADILDRGEWTSFEYSELIRSGSPPLHRIIWSGYAHNAASLMLAMLSTLSLGWIRDRMQARHARWAMQAGCCPSCRYDLRGELEGGCPECGWRRDGSPR